MKVKELVEALSKCDQEAEVFTEGLNTNQVFVVAEYTHKTIPNVKTVMVADYLDYVDDGMLSIYDKEVVMETK